MSASLDKRTGRPCGDHGTALEALEYALDGYIPRDAPDDERLAFLRHWREGDLDEWPEFYPWLAGREA